MAFDQHSLDPVGVTVRINDMPDLMRDLERASDVVKDEVTKAIHAWGGKVYDAAQTNLSGEVLQVQTGRLKGAWVEQRDPLFWAAQDDVFYGAIHEEGNYPWLKPAWDEQGGDAGAENAIRDGLDRGLKGVGL